MATGILIAVNAMFILKACGLPPNSSPIQSIVTGLSIVVPSETDFIFPVALIPKKGGVWSIPHFNIVSSSMPNK